MFAGPNGSGKSTLNSIISKELLGVYINPDEIEKEIVKFGFLDMLIYFDNSNQEKLWVAQINSGKEFEFKSEIIPQWVDKYLLGVK